MGLEFANYHLTFRYPKKELPCGHGQSGRERTEGEWRITRRKMTLPSGSQAQPGQLQVESISQNGYKIDVLPIATWNALLRLRLALLDQPPTFPPRMRRPPDTMLPETSAPPRSDPAGRSTSCQSVADREFKMTAQSAPPSASRHTPIRAIGQGFRVGY